MSFYKTPVRRLCVVRACGFFVIALVLGGIPFVNETDSEGRIISFTFAGFCILMGIFNLWRSRRASPSDTVTKIPELTLVPDQARYFRRMFWLSIVVFPAMTVWVAYDLHRLESGVVERIRIWWPASLVYDHFGFWPAVLLLPVIGLICTFVFIYKLRKINASIST